MKETLRIEEILEQMRDYIEEVPPISTSPTKILISPAQMAVMRQMMDAGTFSNAPMEARKDIYEKEEKE